MAIKPFTIEVTYDQYSAAVASLAPGAPVLAFSLPAPMLKWLGSLKEFLTQLAEDVKLGFNDLIEVFRQRDMYALMKGIGWSIKKLVVAIDKFTSLVPNGILKVMHLVAQSGVISKLQSGAMTLDQLLNEHPILKKLAGPALAGLLLWIWLSSSFIGNFSYDMDLSMIIDALVGKFSLHDLFLTPEGLAMLALFAAGTFTGLGVAWLGSTTYNLLVALAFTAAKKLKDSSVSQKLKPLLELKRY